MKKKQRSVREVPKVIRKEENVSAASLWGNRNYQLLFLVLLATLIIYFPILGNDFVNWDDHLYILDNPLIRTINLKALFSKYVMGNYHPITMLVYSIEYKLFGLDPKGYHLVNLIIHVLNVILVYFTIYKLSDKVPVALIASLVFGVHPMHVESVAWASELKDVLFSFFFLASLVCYLKFKEQQQSKFYVLSLFLFLLSLMSKAMAVPLPVILLLIDYLRNLEINRRTIMEKVPFFVLAIIFGIVALSAQKTFAAFEDIGLFTFPQRVLFAGSSFVSYIIKYLAPIQLSAYYPFPYGISKGLPAIYYFYFFLSIALIVFVFFSLRYTKKLFFGISFFLVTIFLVLQLLPVGGAMMADRYIYIPSVGICYLAGEGFYWLWTRSLTGFNTKWPTAILTALFILFFSYKTYERCGVWNNSMDLWNDVIRQYQTVPAAYNNRGMLLKNTDRYDEMLHDFNKAIELKPDFFDAYLNRGSLFNIQKRYPEAISDFEKAIKLRPNAPEVYNNRGIAYFNSGKKEEGCRDFKKAFELGFKPAEKLLNSYCK